MILRLFFVCSLLLAFMSPPVWADTFEETLLAAEQGDAAAQYSLGDMYRLGQGVPQDYKEAAKWYRLTAEQGDVLAQFNLGFMYVYGRGVPQDDEEAVKWYRLAAEQGHAAAQSILGDMYLLGRGVPQDDIQAYIWWAVALANGDEKTKSNMDILRKQMTPAQMDRAQQLAKSIWERISELGAGGSASTTNKEPRGRRCGAPFLLASPSI